MKNILLLGPMGVGKTTIAKILSKKIKKKIIDSDNVIELIFGMPITLIFIIYGELFLRKLEIKIFNKLIINNSIIFSVGGGSIKSYIINFLFKKKGLKFYLKIKIYKLLSRKYFLKNRPLLKSFNLIDFLFSYFYKRNFLYKKNTNIIINVNDNNKYIITKKILFLFLKNFMLT